MSSAAFHQRPDCMYMPYLTTYRCRIDILTWMQLTGRGSPAVPRNGRGSFHCSFFFFFTAIKPEGDTRPTDAHLGDLFAVFGRGGCLWGGDGVESNRVHKQVARSQNWRCGTKLDSWMRFSPRAYRRRADPT